MQVLGLIKVFIGGIKLGNVNFASGNKTCILKGNGDEYFMCEGSFPGSMACARHKADGTCVETYMDCLNPTACPQSKQSKQAESSKTVKTTSDASTYSASLWMTMAAAVLVLSGGATL
jgi:hypothetical protein